MINLSRQIKRVPINSSKRLRNVEINDLFNIQVLLEDLSADISLASDWRDLYNAYVTAIFKT